MGLARYHVYCQLKDLPVGQLDLELGRFTTQNPELLPKLAVLGTSPEPARRSEEQKTEEAKAEEEQERREGRD